MHTQKIAGYKIVSHEDWSSPEKVDRSGAEGLLLSLDGDFSFESMS